MGRTPLFALQSEYDNVQLGMILGSFDVATVNEWGSNLTHSMEKQLLRHNVGHGGFVDSCSHHCGSWGRLYVGKDNQPAAFQEWYEKGSAALPNKGYFSQKQKYPCKHCGCDDAITR